MLSPGLRGMGVTPEQLLARKEKLGRPRGKGPALVGGHTKEPPHLPRPPGGEFHLLQGFVHRPEFFFEYDIRYFGQEEYVLRYFGRCASSATASSPSSFSTGLGNVRKHTY